MAKIVEKKVRMSHRDIIKYQLITETFINKIHITKAELDCLTLLGAYGECELADFCNSVVSEKMYGTAQSVRNFLNKATKSKLIIKNPVPNSNKKVIQLNPTFQIQTEGTIVLDYKMIHVTQK